MYTRKKLPKTQYELSKGVENKEFGRANDIRRDDDNLQDLSIGLFDLDYTIKFYFDNIIKPEIEEAGVKVKVPVVYGSPEKWKNIQADGYFRDKNGKIQAPLIAYKRSSITKNKTLTNKVDANFPNVYNTQEIKYTQNNRYDQFTKLTNSKPIKTFINTVVPDYVDITYDVVIWTDYVEGMNKIVESVLYTEGSYWGDIEKFKFRTKIDSFTNTTDLLQDTDRIVRTSFQLTLYGYIIPDVMARELSKKQSEKSYDPRQVIIETSVDADASTYREVDRLEAASNISFTQPSIRTVVNPLNILNDGIGAYLNINKAIQASSVSIPNIAIFSGTFAQAPTSLPPTSIDNFTFFINGQYIEPSALTSFVESAGSCILTINPAQLGFTLASTDEIIAVGKFA